MTIYVFGSMGMLGTAVWRELEDRNQLATGITRYSIDLAEHAQKLPFGRLGISINCAGIVRGRLDHTADMEPVNAILPHSIAERSARLVHVSTDCVFDGQLGDYSEDSPVSPSDAYGRTKFNGEVTDPPHLTVRCSVIGFGKRGLLAWFLSQPKGATIQGYANAEWSGLDAATYASYLVDLAMDDTITGLLHIPAPRITKHDLLCKFRDAFRPDIIVKKADEPRSKMTLVSNRWAGLEVAKLNPLPSWDTMIEGLHAQYSASHNRNTRGAVRRQPKVSSRRRK